MLVSAASTGSNKKDCNLFKVNIKGLIKGNRAGQLSKRSEKSAQMRNEVSSFYEENSAPLPLKKKVSKKTGMAQRAMKRSTEALYKDYRQKGGAASLASFFRLRSKHVRTICKSPLNQCLCEYCTNVKLKLATINKFVTPGKRLKDEYTAVSKTDCNLKNKQCMYRQCKDCGVRKMMEDLQEVINLAGPFHWYKWQQKKMT